MVIIKIRSFVKEARVLWRILERDQIFEKD